MNRWWPWTVAPTGSTSSGGSSPRRPGWLRPGGSLLIETGREQSVITAGEMRAVGLRVEVVIDDERDATVVIGTMSPDPESGADSAMMAP